jgi:hypothetical protein
MIISASRKTDLPACYGEWFRHRLRAGYCKTVNPYYRSQHQTVSLRPGDVDGFVFWTKHVGPFFPALAEVAALGLPFVVHHTVNAYPRAIEAGVPPTERALADCRRLAADYGPRALVWRYDPVVISDLTPPVWHLANFARLAEALEGCTDEIATKYVNPYRKTRRNLDRSAADHDFRWWDPPDEEKAELLRALAAIAAQHGLSLTACCQPALLGGGVEPATCIDAVRLADIGGRPFAARHRPIRNHCRCAASVDIGEYDTCPQGCVYCYANQHKERALARYRRHDPDGEYLFTPEAAARESSQLALF